jgi:aminopeptidase N
MSLRSLLRAARAGVALLPFGTQILSPLPSQGAETTTLQTRQSELHCACARSHFSTAPSAPSLLKPDAPDYRKYAPDRAVDFLHLTLEITPDFQKRSLQGIATFRFTPILTPLSELKLDAADLSVSKVTGSVPGLSHQTAPESIHLYFNPPLPPGKPAEVSIHYRAEPALGLYFRTRDMGYPETHLWTQGEPLESRHWFPCFDHPIEKLTSEMICHVPPGMVALSNGRQVSAQPTPKGTTFRWIQEQPHSAYLITLVAGEFEKLETFHGKLPLQFWSLKSDFPQAHNSFRNTASILDFFEKEIGIPYPWAKYGQVTVRDYHWGGMENTSLTTLNANTLFSEETEELFTSDSLVAHELAHQWFGDLVTCKDWSHTWLNEGFATYYDWLWQGHFKGQDELRLNLFNAANGILANTKETRGIVWRKFEQPGEMFNYLAYPKGAWILHMLRSQLGETVFRNAIQTYLQRHAFQPVSTDQLRFALEEASGKSLERFFDQWVSGIGAPHLEIESAWDEKTHQAKLSVKQTQPISEDAHLFQFPLQLRFKTASGVFHHTVEILRKEESFFIPLSEAPEIVRIDPSVSLLAKIHFKMPRPMALALLGDSTDPIGQLLALEQLAEKPDREVVEKIGATLEKASLTAVRQRAAETLRKAGSPEALEHLLKARSQSDCRVRLSVLNALGGFLQPQALEGLHQHLRAEKNPGVAAAALRSLALHQTPETRELLLRYLNTPCYRDRLAEGALEAIRRREDASFFTPLLEAIRAHSPRWPNQLTAAALETLGHLHRNESKRDTAREVLLPYLQDPRGRLRIAAIQGLGNLLDPAAIPALEAFSNLSPYRAEREPALKAIEKIRAARSESEEFKSLRSELEALRTKGREFEKELEMLKKRLDPAKTSPPK